MNQSTLRLWSDSGRVPVFLTPGGHRRFRTSDLLAMTRTDSRAHRTRPLSVLFLESRARYEAVARRAFQSSRWFRHIDDQARSQFRTLGNAMLRLLATYVISTSVRERDRSLERGRQLAAEYGELAARLGLSLVEATEAFVLFRNPILDLVHRWLDDQPGHGSRAGGTLRRVNHFMDEVLLSMAAAHEQRTAHPERANGT